MNIPPLIQRPGDKPGDPVRRYLARQRRKQERTALFVIIVLATLVYLLVKTA